MRSRTHLKTCLFVAWISLIVLACNLTGDSSGPPTIAPRATQTPQPTIGYATLSPDELPEVASTQVANVGIATSLINMTNQVETDRLMLHIDNLQNFGSRHVNSGYGRSDWGIGAAGAYIKSEFEKIQAESQGRLYVFEHGFEIEFGGVRSQPYNVAAFLSGTEPGAGTVLLGAHYDSMSIDYEDGNALAPGANDNGSGVAALLEMARILSKRNHRTSIMFVAFSAEEIQRRGSIAFIRDYLLPHNVDLNVMLNMDLIGNPLNASGAISDDILRIYSSGPNESSSRHAARTLELLTSIHVPYMSISIQDAEDREGRYGDHMSFSEAGYPAVRFVESLENPTRQHNNRDTIDGVQAAYFTRVTQTILTLTTSLADGLNPPRNMALRDAGNGARTLVWEPIPGASGYVVALRRPNALRYDRFEINEPGTTSVTWDGFVPDRFVALAIATRDAEGLVGPLSPEFIIR